jgi:hypothetical protein
MSIKSRISKLESINDLDNKLEVIVVCNNEDPKILKRERFGPDGPPANATIVLVNTGVPRSEKWHG